MTPKTRIQKAFDRAAPQYDTMAVFQQETAQELLQFLKTVSMTPSWVLDGGCGTALSAPDLQKMWPTATIVGCDLSPNMLKKAQKHISYCVCSDLELLPFNSHFDLIWSNLALQWCQTSVFQELARVLKPRGYLAFTTLGPQTLTEIHAAFEGLDRFNHVHTFLTQEALKAALKSSHLSLIAFHHEIKTLFFKDFKELLLSLRGIGANQIGNNYRSSLMGKNTWKKAQDRYEHLKTDQGYPLTYEVFYALAASENISSISAK